MYILITFDAMKPTLPQGTRDFSPETVRKRNYIFDTIQKVFELYGYQPLETPAFENLETLTGKYGDEGDKLIFKILNNGLDNPAKKDIVTTEFAKILEGKSSRNITERALRYDLTIPFARYVAMNHGQLNFPFKRYQMQPVWRADRPQRGRYREFYQFDADVVGSRSLINEVELASIYQTVFTQLGFPSCTLKINSRNILAGIMERFGLREKEQAILVIIDKTDKIGIDGIKQELAVHLDNEQLENIIGLYSQPVDQEQKIAELEKYIGETEKGRKGIDEVKFVLNNFRSSESFRISLDLTLARGLNYYTGVIFEVTAENSKIGSIGGGGRYDDLTGLFGVPGVPGVGISFGVDRVYDVMEDIALFPENLLSGPTALFFNMGENESTFAFQKLQELRAKGISGELYHESSKMDKQFKYAERKKIPFAVIIGSKEMAEGKAVVKDLAKGVQEIIDVDELEGYLKGK